MTTTTDRVAGRYRLRRRLGEGGMGIVWQAYDELLQRDVAVKEVRFPPEISPEDRARLAEQTLTEARAVAAIDTAAAVRVFDIVEQDSRPWIVMELVRGPTLTDVLRERTALPVDEVAGIGLCLLEALEVAHRAGVVHGDVKPSNVILGEDGRIALTDFGIATLHGDGDGDDGDTDGVVVGSPPFLAPERLHGAPPTPASDFFALGATLWTAVEGQPPFGDAVPTQHTQEPPALPPLPRCNRCTPHLAALLRDLLAADPDLRPDAPTIRAELDEVCRESRVEAATAPEPYPAEPLAPTFDRTRVLGPAATTPSAGATGGRSWPLLVAVLVVLLVAAGVLALLVRVGPGAAPAGKPSQHPSAATRPTLPAGWHRYHPPSGGWSIAVPAGWQPEFDGYGIRLLDPAGGRYVEVSTRRPAGGSTLAAWRCEQTAFSSSHADYQLLRIAPVKVPGARDAADWEFTYVDGGAALHALDRGLVVDDVGYAVFFQTHADMWASSGDLRQSVLASFRPAR